MTYTTYNMISCITCDRDVISRLNNVTEEYLAVDSDVFIIGRLDWKFECV